MTDIRSIQRRADTLLRKANELFVQTMDLYGVDGKIGCDVVTDFSDDVVVTVSELCTVLNRAALARKETP